MQKAAHDKAFAKAHGISQSTAREFVKATPSTKRLPEHVKPKKR